LDEGELKRFAQYPIRLNLAIDYIFAPSVVDAHQSQGIGTVLLSFVESELRKLGLENIILWGGVQQRNQKAVQFYKKKWF
jgi:GNAT superfamily N-acetyltransferase